MERKEIETLVKAFLEEEMEIDSALIADEALLRDDLGLESLDFVDIVVIVEKTFGFKIKPEEIAAVRTVDEFCSYIHLKTTAQTVR